MNLSEAIFLGSKLKPQGFMELEYSGKTCAMGAALDALGRPFRQQEVGALWKWTMKRVQCPACERKYLSAFCIITHLNDNHLWSRERIADWVSTIEPKEEVSNETHRDGSNQTERMGTAVSRTGKD